VRPTKTKPSTKTAVNATWYGTIPEKQLAIVSEEEIRGTTPGSIELTCTTKSNTKTKKAIGVIRRTGTVETNNRVGKVGVQTHSRSKGNGHVGEESHAEGCQSGDGSSGSDEVTLDDCFAEEVLVVGRAEVRHALRWANTGTASVSQDSS
jgi:hypothetical protein